MTRGKITKNGKKRKTLFLSQMNFRQFLKDIHATFFLFLVGDETKPEKTTEKSQNGENGKHNLDLLLLF